MLQADSVQPMQLDAEERGSVYMQLVLGNEPLGIVFESPRNPVKLGERCRPRVHVLSEDSSGGTDEYIQDDNGDHLEQSPNNRRENGKGKRVRPSKRTRPDCDTSMGSSGDCNDDDHFTRNQIMCMRKTARMTYKNIKRRLLPKIKKMIVDVFEAMRCSTHS